MRKFKFQWGAFLMFLFYLGLFFLLFGRILFIQITGEAKGQALVEMADSKYARQSILAADRGKILDRNDELIAADTLSYRLVAVLDESLSDKNAIRHVDDPMKTAEVLAQYIPMEKEELIIRLTRTEEDRQNNVRKQIEFGKAGSSLNHETVEKLKAEKLPGILFLEEKKRFYPNGVFASYLIGFAQRENDEDGKVSTVGKMGLESTYNDLLTGTDGKVQFQADKWGFTLPKSEKAVTPVQHGFDIKLTIDKTIENFVEEALDAVELEYAPKKMLVVVANPKTGEILAMSQRPTFDPTTREGLTSNWLNDAIENTIEPGSTMKMFTLAAAMEEKKWDPHAYYPSGQYTLYDKTIRDHNRTGWGTITFKEGFERSSNVSMAYLLERLGDRKFIEYMEAFGFGQKTAIDLPNEAAGIILDNYPSERLTTAYGQGSTVTPIQMIQAATAIANDGKMMKPFVIDEITNPNNGELIMSHEAEEKESPISKETAQQVRAMLASTVTSPTGTGRGFALDGYTMGGKTGTAEIPGDGGAYLRGNGNYLYSFLGMAPIEDPQLLTYVIVQQPTLKAGEYGSIPVAKVFKPIMENSLKYLNILPVDEEVIEGSTIDDYTNTSVLEAVSNLEALGHRPIVIGDGDKVMGQYPSEGVKLSLQSVVLLQTTGDIQLPDFTGWSKKMVLAYKTLSGLDLRIMGDGYVTHQSLSEGISPSPNEPIVIQLQKPSDTYQSKEENKEEEIVGG